MQRIGGFAETVAAVAVLACTCIFSTVKADIVISEIMYNPDSQETGSDRAEWVELYSTDPVTADLEGWKVSDEDVTPSDGFPAGTSIAPGEAIVIVSNGITEAQFEAAWGTGFQIIQHDLPLFSNGPSSTNEILQLLDEEGTVVDEVNYDDSGEWPRDTPDGASIYVLPDFVDAVSNDEGLNWARSTVGVDSAFTVMTTSTFDGPDDVGSPGRVVVPEPTGLVTLALCTLPILGRSFRPRK